MTSPDAWIWPTDFPEGCPPDQAPSANGTCFRIVKNDPPISNDFVSVYHQNRTRAEREISNGTRSPCETLGLSVFTVQDHAVRCAQQYPKLGDKIVTLALTRASGKMAQTGGGFDSHNTWWKAEQFDPTGSVQRIDRVQNP